MAVNSLNIAFNGCCWESEPLCCSGGDVRVRVHKKGPYPVNILVSIDGEEDYIKHDDFGLDSLKNEITIEGAMRGQYIKFSSKSELLLIKYMEQ